MSRWLIRAALALIGLVAGYWLVFALRFIAVVLPHGGMW